ncbi:unnamed protein product [Discula destructiva]
MAGLKHFKLAADPGINRLNTMMSNRYKYFRWTPRTAWLSFVYMIAVPTALGTVAYRTDGKYSFRAKRKGDLVYEY